MARKTELIFSGKTVVSEAVESLAASILGDDYRPLFALSSGNQHYGRIRPDGSKLGPVWLIPRKDGCIRVIFRMPKDAPLAASQPTFGAAGCRPCDGRDWQCAVGDAKGVPTVRRLIAATMKLHGVKIAAPAAAPAARKRTARKTAVPADTAPTPADTTADDQTAAQAS